MRGKDLGTPEAGGASRLELLCNYCGNPAKQVGGEVIYPHRPDLYHKRFFACRPCDAMVGCHPDGRPLGRLANAELRKAKMAAHAAFDPLWKSGELSRNEAYAWLQKALDIPKSDCHIGMMDIAGCAAVVKACAQVVQDTLAGLPAPTRFAEGSND